jgi:hypothetical protein
MPDQPRPIIQWGAHGCKLPHLALQPREPAQVGLAQPEQAQLHQPRVEQARVPHPNSRQVALHNPVPSCAHCSRTCLPAERSFARKGIASAGLQGPPRRELTSD